MNDIKCYGTIISEFIRVYFFRGFKKKDTFQIWWILNLNVELNKNLLYFYPTCRGVISTN